MNPIRQAKADLDRIHAHGYHELATKHRLTLELLLGYHTLGYPTAGQGRGTGVADPTGNAAAAAAHDEIDRWLTRFCTDIAALTHALDDLSTLVALTRTLDPKQVADILRAERPGVSTCTKCSKIVTGTTRLDRIKLGLCPACYQADYRARHPDGQTSSEIGFQRGVVAS